MKFTIAALALAALLISCKSAQEPAQLDPQTEQELTAYLQTHRQTPEEYVLTKFADHDVVMLGEQHRIRQNVELIQRLIPLLHKNGIHVLATEFARREDQVLIDSLLAGESYDEALAREITFRQLVTWGFQEYVDIFKAAWQVNHVLPDTVPRLRILGMNDSPDWSIMKTVEDREKDELKRQVWRGGGEHLWARTVTDAVMQGEKVLVYCGIHHGFSGNYQPVVAGGKFVRFDSTRTGNYVKRALGDRVMTVFLHAPWHSREGYSGKLVRPAGGTIDMLMEKLGAQYYPAGFDLRGTPFGKIPDSACVYSHGYEHFTMEKFCDGWIYQCPLSEYFGVTPIPGFVNERNLEYAQQQSPHPRFRNSTVQEFTDAIERDAKQEWFLKPFRKQ